MNLAEALAILESRGLKVVPVEPTLAMVQASERALFLKTRDDPAHRLVNKKHKHRLRLEAAIHAAPTHEQLLEFLVDDLPAHATNAAKTEGDQR